MLLSKKRRNILNAAWSAESDRRGTTQRRWFVKGRGNVSALEVASSELRRKKVAIVDIGLEMSSRQYPRGLPLHQSRWKTSLNGACWNKATKNRGVCAPNRHATSRPLDIPISRYRSPPRAARSVSSSVDVFAVRMHTLSPLDPRSSPLRCRCPLSAPSVVRIVRHLSRRRNVSPFIPRQFADAFFRALRTQPRPCFHGYSIVSGCSLFLFDRWPDRGFHLPSLFRYPFSRLSSNV